MKHLPTFTAATPADAAELARAIRPADAVEIAIASGMPPAEACLHSFRCSDVTLAARVGPDLVCLFGVRALSLLDRTAVVWLIGSPALDRHWRVFTRHSRRGLLMAAQSVPWAETLGNAVWDGNTRTVRWLAWLGASFGNPVYLPGKPAAPSAFLPFTIERSALCVS